VALRGIRDGGRALQLERQYIKEGVRAIAEDFYTRQLGHRTELDTAGAERREVQEKRFTSLDRTILKHAEDTSDGTWLHVRCQPSRDALNESACSRGRQPRRCSVRLRTGQRDIKVFATTEFNNNWPDFIFSCINSMPIRRILPRSIHRLDQHR
jgi:type IV secretory pathway VirD2 relaxase